MSLVIVVHDRVAGRANTRGERLNEAVSGSETSLTPPPAIATRRRRAKTTPRPADGGLA